MMRPLVEILAVMVSYEAPHGHRLVQKLLQQETTSGGGNGRCGGIGSFYVLESFMNVFRVTAESLMHQHMIIDKEITDFLVSARRNR